MLLLKTKKSNLQDQVRKLEEKLEQQKKDSDAEKLSIRLEMACLQGQLSTVEKNITQVTTLKTSLQLERNVLDDDRLYGWEVEKKLVKAEGFAQGFNEWCSGFLKKLVKAE